MTTVVALIAILVLCIGLAMLVANPTRLTNQLFALGAFILAAELLIINRSIEEGIHFINNKASDPLFWVRISAVIKAFFPSIIRLIGASIENPKHNLKRLLVDSYRWLIAGTALSSISATDWYIPSTSLPNNITKGPAYIAVTAITIASWSILLLCFMRASRRESGIRKVEMQFLVVNIVIASLLSTTLFSIGHIIAIPEYKHAALATIAMAFAVTGWGLTYYRVFEIKETATIIIQKIPAIAALYFSLIILNLFFHPSTQTSLDAIIQIAIAGALAIWIDRATCQLFGPSEDSKHVQFRYNIIAIAKNEPSIERLISRLENSLKKTYGSKYAQLKPQTEAALKSGENMIDKKTPAWSALCEIGWATPESLDRRRPSTGIRELQSSMEKNDIGLIVTTPQGSPEPALLVALGMKESGSPYTYPEIKRIQEIAELMDNLLVRSQLSAQLELQARFESLAIMSRGLAHDLKNLITPVATFLNTYESKQKPCAEEDSVYAAARRSMRVISDYVEETHFFSKQMVPRLEPVNPVELMRDVALALRAKAERESVTLEVGLSTEEVIRADRVLLLRLLSNLVDNAIDASSPGCRVCLHARWGHDGHMKISVIDSGAGISSDILPRIFEPYFTTKDRGTSLRGFGLGLAICQKIVEIHGGKIGVRTAPGAGTTFEVSIPKGEAQPHLGTDPETALATRIPPVPAAA